ncbi:hypothetical protein [Paenibacillus taiwanensis]|uniref:hypothetical protein n=1 Tax=Paenibacillus taiwanensis TaxID=401638 RepID=UPI00041607F7|nr:hypothetical protein [Paenibacillus taiwanensis]
MENINFQNTVKSFFLGLFIGIVLQLIDNKDVLLTERLLAILASGSIGFIIGLITEWLTAILPIRIARVRTYFFINNLIALVVTSLIMAALIWTTHRKIEAQGELVSMMLIVLGIVCIANLIDYVMYRRAQHQLDTFKARMKEK